MSNFDGVYHNVPNGFTYLWEKAGWKALPHVYNGTHHEFYGTMMKWEGEGEPIFPTVEADDTLKLLSARPQTAAGS